MLYNNITTHHRRKQSNGKVVIVDYDDTILPSTFVDRWQIENSKDLPQHVSCKNAKLTTFIFERIAYLFSKTWELLFYELLRRSLFEFSHTDNLIFRFLFVLRRPIIQFQNMLEELSRATERFLEEASKYGEVSLFTLFYYVFLFAWNFVCFSFENPFIPMVVDWRTRKPKLIC